MDESCQIWMSHVKYGWVMSNMNELCHIWMSHVTHEWVTSHIHIWICHILICRLCSDVNRFITSNMNYFVVTDWWVTSHLNESCHIWMGRIETLQVNTSRPHMQVVRRWNQINNERIVRFGVDVNECYPEWFNRVGVNIYIIYIDLYKCICL